MYLSIDAKKVLSSKAPKMDPLTESFNLLKMNQTPINVINFMASYRKSPKDVIIENLGSLCDINSDITFSYFHNVLETASLSESTLNGYKEHLISLRESSDDPDYQNRLDVSVAKIDYTISDINDMDTVREEMLLNLSIDRIRRSCVFESYLEDDLEVLIYNINSSPETITEYEQLIRKIKVSKTSEYFSSYPMLLVKNTDMIRNLSIRVTGDVLDLLTCMPTVIADKLCETNMSDSVVKSYMKIFDKQIATMYIELKHNDPSKYQLYSTYVRNMIGAKRKISDKYGLSSVTESHIIEDEILEEKVQNPFKVFSHANKVVGKAGWAHYIRNQGPMIKNLFVDTSKSYKGLWSNLLKMVDNCRNIDEVNYLRRDLNISTSQLSTMKQNNPERAAAIDEHIEWINSTYRKALNDKAKELRAKSTLKESFVLENIAEMQPDIVMYDEAVIEDIISEMENSLVNMIFDPGEELDEVELENFTRLCRVYEATRKMQKGAIRAGHKAGSMTQTAVNKIKSASTDAKRAALPVKKSLQPIANMLSNTINKLKEMDSKERTERIITGEYRMKLVNYIRSSIIGLASLHIGVGVGKAVGKATVGVLLTPAKWAGLITVAIGILAGVAINKKIDAKHRQKILADLKGELAITNEKIEDAKSDGDKKAKYELMRIKQKLERDIERIEFNLD